MVLPFLVPIVGAALGGAIGSFFGGAILTGMSIGWMVGSWLFPMGGDPSIEPTAAQLQDVNQSLRGQDIAILFGTQRVSPSIILRDNFDVDKKTESSGGFFGFGEQKEVVFEYQLDIVYHYGIPYTDTGFQIFAGWKNDDILSSKTLESFVSNADGDHPVVTKATFQNEITKFINYQNKPKAGVGMTRNAGVNDHWSSGRLTTSVWGHINNLTSHNIRWPYQVWMGHRGLHLDQAARIPQFSLEIGPIAGAGELKANSGESLTGNSSLSGIARSSGRMTDQHGSLWRFDDGLSLQVISRSGTLLYTSQESEWLGRLADFYGFSYSPSVSDRGFKYIQPILNGTKVAVFFGALDTSGTTHLLHCSITEPMTTAGTPEIRGSVWVRDILNGASRGFSRGVDHAHFHRVEDPLVYHGGAGGALNDFQSYVFPDPQGIESGAYAQGWGASTVGQNVGTTAVWSIYEVPRILYQLPTAADREDAAFDWTGIGDNEEAGWVFMLPIGQKTALWFPITLGVHQYHDGTGANPNPAYQNSISLLTSGDQGGAYYYLFDNHSADVLRYESLLPPVNSPQLKNWSYTADTWILATSHFINQDGDVTMPFSDDQRTLAGASVSGGGNAYSPQPGLMKEDDDNWCLAWSKSSTASADTQGGSYSPVTVRGYQYDRSLGRFLEFGTDTRTTPFFSSSLDFDPVISGDWSHKAFHIRGGVGSEELHLAFIDDDQQYIAAEWGVFNCQVSSHTDLTPPEIIRHIMVNSLYGLSLDTNRIDAETYSSAYAYCNTEDFRVSGIYRTSEDRSRYIEQLLATYGGYLVWTRGKLKFGFVTGSDTVVRTLSNEHHAVKNAGDPPLRVMKGSRQDTFNKIQVHYLDRRLAYRTNMVEISDEVDIQETGVRVREFPARFVMKEAMATKMAHRTLWSNLFARDTIQGAVGWKDADLEPGDVVWLVDSHHAGELSTGIRARLVSMAEQAPGLFAYNAVQEDPSFLNDQGFVTSETLGSPSNGFQEAGIPQDFAMFETTEEFAPSPLLYFALMPNNDVAGARAYTSGASDGSYGFAGEALTRPLAGRLQQAYGPGRDYIARPTFLFLPTSDHSAGSADFVRIASLSVTPGDRQDGNALFLVGSEIMAVESLTSVGSNLYRASRAYRGWGGTHVQCHAANAALFWLDQAVVSRPFVPTEIGKTVFYKVTEVDFFGGETELSSVTPKQHKILGQWHGPQVTGATNVIVLSEDMRGNDRFGVDSGDNIVFEWPDSSPRAGFGFKGFGTGGFGDFAADVKSHSWEIVITGSGGSVVRTTEVTTATFSYTHSANVADNGAYGPFAISITPVNNDVAATRSLVRSLTVWEK